MLIKSADSGDPQQILSSENKIYVCTESIITSKICFLVTGIRLKNQDLLLGTLALENQPTVTVNVNWHRDEWGIHKLGIGDELVQT